MRKHAAALGLDRDLLVIASVVVVGAIMTILDTTIVNVALDRLTVELHATVDSVQWVTTGYMLALAVVIPLTGWASERFGARAVWLTSVALFVAGSVLCGAAWSLESLIAFRVLQGIGGGMVMPVGMILMAQAAGPQRVGRVMSIIGVPMLLAPVLGPVIGGLIVDNLSWRWIFFVNVPVGLLGIALGLRWLPRGRASDHPGRLDWLGLALLSPGLGLFVFGLSEVSMHGGLGATGAWLPLVAGALLIAAFARHALRARRPLIDVRLFREPTFSSAAATTFLVALAMFGSLLLLPLFFQVARGESALHAGLLLAPQGLGAALTMPSAGALADRIGGGRVALAGIALMTVATVPLALIGPGTSLGVIEAALFVRGMALGATFMPAMAAAYATLEPAAVPRATSALNVIQRVGGSIGTAILAVVLSSQIGETEVNRAFAHTFWWTVALTALAILPALVLVRATPRPEKTPAIAEA
jgi:EmrB/QacA subfamily drug resistance transporter